jgi:signal peptide peptidase SppA
MHAKDVRTIVLDVNSPGGAVAGSTEFAQEILRARATKPIVAVAQYLMGSAAYHLSAVATEVVAAPSALVGGIGVYTIHDDLSKSLEKLGVTRTFITAGEGKVDGNSSQPLTETARARLAAAVDEAYDQFVTSVVRGRGAGMTPARVRGGWKAHVYTASEALELGMIDRIDTLDQTLARLLSASPDKTDQQLADTVRGVDTSQEPIGATDQDHASAGLATNALLQQLYTLEL